MARSKTPKAPKTKTGPKTCVEDNFVAPKRKPREKAVTLAEALAESGETIEELRAPEEEAVLERIAGTSNLAQTIRNHRHRYAIRIGRNGKKTQDAGDTVAKALLHASLPELKEWSVVQNNGKAYDHLNDGHARMCIGNAIRALLLARPLRMIANVIRARFNKNADEAIAFIMKLLSREEEALKAA